MRRQVYWPYSALRASFVRSFVLVETIFLTFNVLCLPATCIDANVGL